MRLQAAVMALFACGADAVPVASHEVLVVPECPSTALVGGRVPVFPGASVSIVSATTRGFNDSARFTGSVPASFELARAFYAECLGSAPELDGRGAYFARPHDGAWMPGKGRARVPGPAQMFDRVVLTNEGDRTHLEIVVVYP